MSGNENLPSERLSMSIKQKLILFFLLIAAIPLVLIATLSFTIAKNSLKNLTLNSLKVIAEFKEGEVFFFIEKLKTRTEDFASDGFIRDALIIINSPGSENIFMVKDLSAHLLKNKKTLDDSLGHIDILNIGGKVVASTDANRIGLDFSEKRYYQRGKIKTYVSDIHKEEDGGDLAIDVSAPIKTHGRTPKVVGVLVNHFHTSTINDILTGKEVLQLGAKTQLRGIGKTGETYLVNQDWLLITDSLNIKDAAFRQLVKTLPAQKCFDENKEISGLWLDYRGVPAVGASMCIDWGDYKWTLISEQDAAEAFQPINKLRNFCLVFGAIILAIAALAAFLIARSISGPIGSLAATAEDLGKGDLSKRVHIPAGKELSMLASSFNQMAENLMLSQKNLKKHALHLEHANRELEDFNYIASHDLQEPLRTLSSYCELLEKDVGDDISSRAIQDMEFIKDAAKRMKGLVQDLLQLSRVGCAEMKMMEVDLGQCMEFVVRDLEFRIKETNGRVEWNSLPTVKGDSTLLTRLLQNLVGNGLKFHGEKPPVIKISASRINSDWEITVADNGIGMETQYLKQIFLPFKRLHGMRKYEGSGIGLSICRKIVLRHDGDIFAESETGLGSKFKFILKS